MTANTAIIITKVRLQVWRLALNTIIHAVQHGNAAFAVKSLIELRDMIGREIASEAA